MYQKCMYKVRTTRFIQIWYILSINAHTSNFETNHLTDHSIQLIKTHGNKSNKCSKKCSSICSTQKWIDSFPTWIFHHNRLYPWISYLTFVSPPPSSSFSTQKEEKHHIKINYVQLMCPEIGDAWMTRQSESEWVTF